MNTTQDTISVLVVEPEKAPYPKTISSGLKSLQQEVGGDIQAIYPYSEPVALVCNEEGKLEGLPLNRALRDENGQVYDVVAGTFLIVGLGEESFQSLPDDLMQKYTNQFRNPEMFLKHKGRLMVLQISPPKEERTSVLKKIAALSPQPHTVHPQKKRRESEAR